MIDAAFSDLELNYTPWLPADRRANILDVGCGPGRVLAFLAAKGYQRLEGFDRDADAVAAAHSRCGAATLAVEHDWDRYFAGRAGAFDLVVLKDVIYYVPRDRAVDALRVVRQALRPGGRVIVEVFNGASFTGPFVSYKDEAILWTPTEYTVRRFLETAGFSSVAVLPQRPPASRLRRRLFNLIGRAWRLVLGAIYVVERGFSEENPRILTTKIIAVGEVPA